MASAVMASDVSPRLRINFPMADLEDICRRWNVRRLAIFGSAVRGDFTFGSDVDVLYLFEPGKTPGWAMADFQQELASLFGHAVDLVGYKYIYWRIRERVLDEAVVVYDRK